MKKNLTQLMIGLGMIGTAMAQTITTGPNSSESPYVHPSAAGYSITSLLTTGDVIGNYTMVGLPDGLGAFDNNDGTFTLLMNHEFGSGSTGAVHAYGTAGSFVSKWIINKTTLSVVSGADLTQNVHLWNSSSNTYSVFNSTNTSTLAGFSRFCSADLAAVSAYYNSATGKGTQSRIFLDGEESGSEGRMMAHIASGPEAGHSYELPYLGKLSSENQVACPHRSDKTIVAGFDDATPGQVYIYIGNKSAFGNEITKAGLTGGTLYGVAVSGMITEVSGSVPAANTSFSLVSLGQVQAITGSSLNTMSNNLGVTTFLRPEDGAWDPSHPSDLYFNTTNSFNSPSRVWKLHFTDINNPQLGGTITAVLDGTEGQKMLDNMGIDHSGHILLQEDVGGNAHIGKIWEYTIATDALVQIAEHDTTRFLNGGSNFLTQDEEASGLIDVQSILGAGKFLFVDQAHYGQASPLIEGGQLLMLSSANTASSNPEINVQGNSVSIPMGNTSISVGNNTDFGLLNTGLSVNKTFVIQNIGTGPLVISGMDFTGTNAGDFTFVGAPAFPVTVPANGSQNITVKFSPALVGNRTATVNVYNNDYNETIYDFAVQGSGAVPEINLQGNAINIVDGNTSISANNNTDFGSTLANTSVTKSFLIQNTGTGTLTISGMVLSGANASEFSFVTPPTFPLVLAGNASQSFTVQFLPTTAPSTNMASVVISSDDADESSYDFMVEGKGLMDVGITALSKFDSFVSLYPNPAKDEAKLKVSVETTSALSVTVFDLTGKVVLTSFEKEIQKGTSEISLNTTSLKNGEYFVKVISGSKTNTIKMVVMH
jgi:hypothetical protein